MEKLSFNLKAPNAAGGTRAQAILSWHTAVAIHNANPQLAMEALIAQLRGLPEVGAP